MSKNFYYLIVDKNKDPICITKDTDLAVLGRGIHLPLKELKDFSKKILSFSFVNLTESTCLLTQVSEYSLDKVTAQKALDSYFPNIISEAYDIFEDYDLWSHYYINQISEEDDEGTRFRISVSASSIEEAINKARDILEKEQKIMVKEIALKWQQFQ